MSMSFLWSEVSRSVLSNSLRPHGLYGPWILQARMLEWVAVHSSRGFSQPKDRTQVYLYCRWDFFFFFCRWILYQLSHKGSPKLPLKRVNPHYTLCFKFTHIIKLICNPQINTYFPGHSQTNSGENFESSDVSVPCWGWTRWDSRGWRQQRAVQSKARNSMGTNFILELDFGDNHKILWM